MSDISDCGLGIVDTISEGIVFLSDTLASYRLNFERFTDRRFFYIPVNVKLFESPGKAGGLPF